MKASQAEMLARMEAKTETNLQEIKVEMKTGQAEMKATVSAIVQEMKS
jgi:hypothetical protein